MLENGLQWAAHLDLLPILLLDRLEQLRPAFDEARPPRHARRSAQWCQCVYHNTSVLGQVLIVRTRALVFFRSNLISADAPQTPRHC